MSDNYNSHPFFSTNEEFRNAYPVSQTIVNAIDFGFCAVGQTSTREIQLENRNSYPVKFTIEEAAFNFYPNYGVISAKSKQLIQIKYVTNKADVVVSTAILKVENEEPKIIKLSAIGKIPHLTMNQYKLDFEQLLVGCRKTKEVLIKNNSDVFAKFQVVKVQDDDFIDHSFSIDYQTGEIPPKSTFLIKVTFSPKITEMVSVTHFQIICAGGNTMTLECLGTGMTFNVFLSAVSINFGEIRLGKTTSRLLTINNDSDLPTSYEFFNQENNIFSFSRSKGEIPAHQNARIIIYFLPKTTISYYERAWCIIRNHSLQYVDLIGTCYDLLIKPIALHQKHIDLFRQRVIQNRLTKLDIKYLENTMLSNIYFQKSGGQLPENLGASQTLALKDNPQGQGCLGVETQDLLLTPSQLSLHKELFNSFSSQTQLIQLSETFFDFNFTQFMEMSPAREVVVQNKLPCKITIIWTVQKFQDPNEQPVFNIYPQAARLKPQGTAKFSIAFRPNRAAAYFYQLVQFFAVKYNSKTQDQIIKKMKGVATTNAAANFPQSMSDNIFNQQAMTTQGKTKTLEKSRQFEITEKYKKPPQDADYIDGKQIEELVPSLQCYVRCVGHSFPPMSQVFIPIVELYPSNKVYFGPCGIGQSVYQTVQLLNKTDTPTYFRFHQDSSKTFRIFPMSGLVESKQFCVIIIEFCPKQAGSFNVHLPCSLNHSSSSQISLQLIAFCSQPQLSLENNGEIYFPPSYLGVYSQRKLKVHNTSRIPVQFTIQIPEKYQQELFLEPKQMILLPNEVKPVDCKFLPYRKKKYKMIVPCQAQELHDQSQELIGYFLPGSGNKDERNQEILKSVDYCFTIFGAGGDGCLKLSPELINFGIVKVNFNKKIYATLENVSDCTFFVQLTLRQANDHKTKEKKFDQRMLQLLQQAFTLDFEEGIIAAHSKVDIGITFNPNQVCSLNLYLECIAKERNIKGVFTATNKNLTQQKCAIGIKGKGKYPQLKIVDVRNDSMSVATLFESFSIAQINKQLSNDLNDDEKKFLNIEKLNYFEASELMKRLIAYNWNFGYLPNRANVKPRKIVITMQNVGGTDLTWNFKLPSDSQIEVEAWADPGEPTEDEAFEKAILERKIFEIQPKNGKLNPQELVDVELIYSPGNEDDLLLPNDKRLELQQKNEKHFLQVVLQIQNGKPLLLHFQGTQLNPNEGMLVLRKNHFRIPDVPIGSLLPVAFPIEIRNVGSAKVQYKIANTIEEQNQITTSKFKVFDIKCPNTVLPPNETNYLICKFAPLEAKTYIFEQKILVYDMFKQIDEVNFKIEGAGYYKEHPQKKLAEQHEEIPSQRSLVSPLGSKVFFSIEEIDFGELDPGKIEYRMIILYNLSKTAKLHFAFQSTGLKWFLFYEIQSFQSQDVLTIEPQQGDLDPTQFTEIKLSLIAHPVPSIYEGEIECTILWDQDKQKQTKSGKTLQGQTSGSDLPVGVGANIEKETLFLRIKKRSKNLLIKSSSSIISNEIDLTDNFLQSSNHLFEQLISKSITDILNEPDLNSLLTRVDQQPVQLYNCFDGEDPVSINKILQGGVLNQHQAALQAQQLGMLKDTKYLFLQEEFMELADSMLENTFYNIIQETTRKEADLLRISKTYLTSNKQN